MSPAAPIHSRSFLYGALVGIVATLLLGLVVPDVVGYEIDLLTGSGSDAIPI